jgi:hypothetical protein
VRGEPAAAAAAEHTLLIDRGVSDDPSRRALLETLGLGTESLLEDPDPGASPRFRLIVADDYNPCFDPTRRISPAGG